MPRGYNNYSFVIDSSFQPFTMQEMLVPFTAYKEAFEKSEEAYADLRDKADKFKYLSKTLPEDSKARQIYEGYANDLKAQAEDLARNGLGMGNRRALTGLRQRYQGEIGRLVEADTALKQEQALRRQMSAKDPSMLYAAENLNIDNFLNGQTPNLYGISGTDLYTKAAAASQAMSKRQFSVNGQSKTLGGYYYDYIQRMGYTPEQLRQFGDQISADFAAQVSVLPELQQAANQILEANGVNENLTGNSLRKAQQQVIRGLIDGAVYSEQHNPQRNLGVMTAAEKAADARAREAATRAQQQMELSALQSGYKRENGKWVLDEEGIKKRAEIMGIGSYNPDEWEVGPDGKVRRKVKSTTAQTSEEKKENKKHTALLKLGKAELAHNEGFDVTFGDDRHHYNYIGAISKHGDKWHHGAIGDDNPGHNFPGAWGWASTSNVENAWGNFSAEGSDSKDMRVLSPSEMVSLVSNDAELLQAIQERAEAMGIDPNTADIQLIEVPNEKGGGGQKGYLIAVH
jgi:hypothetical protein